MSWLDRIRNKFTQIEEGAENIVAGDDLPHPHELLRKILQQLESKITLLPNGQQGVAFNSVTLHLYADGAEQQDLYQAYYGENRLQEALLARLRERACHLPPRLQVEMIFAAQPFSHGVSRWFTLDCRRLEGVAARAADPVVVVPPLRLIVLHGQAQEPEYFFESERRVNIGRREEIFEKAILRRRNDVVFNDLPNDDINRTVGREHAHLKFDARFGEWQLFSDSRSTSTSIVRAGAPTINVVYGLQTGVRVEDGDEIFCGRARLRVEL